MDRTIKVPCEVYTRVVGYLRPTAAMHQGKRQEVQERVPFRVPEKIKDEQ